MSMVPIVALIVLDQLEEASVFPLSRYSWVRREVAPCDNLSGLSRFVSASDCSWEANGRRIEAFRVMRVAKVLSARAGTS
jgi:hypothetical protein